MICRMRNIMNKEFEHDGELWPMWSARAQKRRVQPGWHAAPRRVRERNSTRERWCGRSRRNQSVGRGESSRGINLDAHDGQTGFTCPDKDGLHLPISLTCVARRVTQPQNPRWISILNWYPSGRPRFMQPTGHTRVNNTTCLTDMSIFSVRFHKTRRELGKNRRYPAAFERTPLNSWTERAVEWWAYWDEVCIYRHKQSMSAIVAVRPNVILGRQYFFLRISNHLFSFSGKI
jgi:hypothetical protein